MTSKAMKVIKAEASPKAMKASRLRVMMSSKKKGK